MSNKTVQIHYKYLVFNVEYTREIYHGKEFPPSPRRLFLAFVDALYQTSPHILTNKPEMEQALKFLENQDPPTIHVSDYVKGSPYTLSVPRNNADVISQYWAKGKKPPKDKSFAKLKSLKTIHQYFLTDTITYVYKIPITSNTDEKYLELLCRLSREIDVVGLGIDPVIVYSKVIYDISDIKKPITYKPVKDEGDINIDVPMCGTLDDSNVCHQSSLEQIQDNKFSKAKKLTKYKTIQYSKDIVNNKDLIVFKLVHIHEQGLKSNQVVLYNDIPNLIHQLDKLKSNILPDTQNVKTIVLPSIGKHGDGLIRRAGFIIESEDHNTIKEKLETISNTILELQHGRYQLQLVDENDPIKNIYSMKSKTWCSVFPVKLKDSNKKIRDNILQKLKDIKIPLNNINRIRFSEKSYWNDSPMINNNQNFQSYVEIKFKENHKGLFIIGENQENRFGLFAPKTTSSSIAYYSILDSKIPIEHTVQIADLMRLATMSKYKDVLGKDNIPDYIHGHNDNNKHVSWLPFDSNKDGFIDHIIVYFKDGFNGIDHDILSTISKLYNSQFDIKLQIRGFHTRDSIGSKCELFSKSKKWRSITPYYAPWHFRKSFNVNDQIQKESLKEYQNKTINIENKESLIDININKQIPINDFISTRGNKKSISNIGYNKIIEFEKEIQGPITIGFGSHYGLGLFVPVLDD